MSSTAGRAQKSGAQALYAYCLVAAPTAPEVATAPPGLPGASRPRLLAAGPRRWLVVADAPLDRFGTEAIERGLGDLAWVSGCAVAHEAVIEHFLDARSLDAPEAAAGALLPMKLFTLFDSEASALAHLSGESQRTTRLLRRLAGCVEYGVRVHFDPARVAAAPAAGAGAPSGRAFLERKQRERDASKQALATARAALDELFEELAAAARDARRLAPPAGPPLGSLLLDAAYLCARTDTARFEAALEAGAARVRPLGCEVVLTGPWPGYHFLEEAS